MYVSVDYKLTMLKILSCMYLRHTLKYTADENIYQAARFLTEMN